MPVLSVLSLLLLFLAFLMLVVTIFEFASSGFESDWTYLRAFLIFGVLGGVLTLIVVMFGGTPFWLRTLSFQF